MGRKADKLTADFLQNVGASTCHWPVTATDFFFNWSLFPPCHHNANVSTEQNEQRQPPEFLSLETATVEFGLDTAKIGNLA
jgi:hypothetical protein